MIIRSKSFVQWFRANFNRQEMRDLSNHGAGTGWQGLTYTVDIVTLYDRFETEIWDALYGDAEDYGTSILAMIDGFNCSNIINDASTFKTACVWYMAERTARNLCDE